MIIDHIRHLQNPLQYYFVCQDLGFKLLESIVPQACWNLLRIAKSGPDVDSNFKSNTLFDIILYIYSY